MQYKTKAGEELKAYAPLTVVCDGCFSNLRRNLCTPKVNMKGQSSRLIYFLKLSPTFCAFLKSWSIVLESKLICSLCLQVDVPSHFVGLVVENCDLPFPNHGHVILADPSPILFYPIGSTEIRCLVDVPGQKLPSVASGEMAKYLKTKVAPQVYIQTAWQ